MWFPGIEEFYKGIPSDEPETLFGELKLMEKPMKKLLHERLREWVSKTDGGHYYPTSFAIKDMGVMGVKDSAIEDDVELFNLMADEIERYYIPRPRFEDGEPIQKDDWFIQKVVDKPVKLDHIEVALYSSEDLNMCWSPDEPLKRPSPKVLDADGVEIKVGDTVWHIQSGKKFTVHTVQSDGCVFSANEIYLEPEAMTHKKPVLDADGVPIKEGETVYTLTSDISLKVLLLDVNLHLEPIVKTDAGLYKPDQLTHKEPDSLEKLLEYLKGKYNLCNYELDEVRDRLSALIERMD